MFEIIGIGVVCWIVFKIIKSIFSMGASTARSQEFGKEARHIATIELKVPSSYYTHLTINKIDAIKNSAMLLRDSEATFQRYSWSRLLALVIYGEFHQDCEQWRLGNPISEQLFLSLGITPEIISRELDRDPSAVIYSQGNSTEIVPQSKSHPIKENSSRLDIPNNMSNNLGDDEERTGDKFRDVCASFVKLSKEPLSAIDLAITVDSAKNLVETVYSDIPEIIRENCVADISAMAAMIIVAKNGLAHGETNAACMLSLSTIWASKNLKENGGLSVIEEEYASELEIEARAIIMNNHKKVQLTQAKLLIAATMTI